MRRRLPLLATAMAVLLAGLWFGARPQAGAQRAEIDEPAPPAPPAAALTIAQRPMLVTGGVDRSKAELAYAKAFANGQTPGVAAFRVTTDAYFDYNLEDAKAKAAQEGLTLDEIRELTYLGHMVLRSQQWGDVQEILGIELSSEQKQLAQDLMDGSNEEFKLRMRELVAHGASEAERWELIQTTEESYLREYFEITGVNAQTLDRLLGGDFGGRTRAPALVTAEQSDNLLANVNQSHNPNPEGVGPKGDHP